MSIAIELLDFVLSLVAIHKIKPSLDLSRQLSMIFVNILSSLA